MTQQLFESATEIEEFYKAAAKNLVEFYRIVCYDGDDDKYLPPAKFHYKISDILLKSTDSFAIQAFRDSGKTSLCINAFCLYMLTFGQYLTKNTYIIIVKQSATLASEKLREIKEAYYGNPLLNIDLKQVVKDTSHEGGVFEIELKGGRRIRIEGKGKGSSGIRGAVWRSTRPTIVILDDVQSIEDIYSDTTIEKDWKWFVREIAFLGKYTRIFMIGNNLGERCLIEKVFKNKNTFNFNIRTMRIPVRNSRGVLMWEHKYNHKEIDRILEGARENDTLEDVYSELFCESITDETRKFKRSYFRYYPLVNVEKIRRECNIYLTCDLAATTKKRSDNSALFVQGVNPDGYRFYLDCIYGKLDEDEIINGIFQLVSRWKPKKVGIEKAVFQRLWHYILEREMGKRNIFFEIAEIESLGEKEARISANLLPLFKTGYIWFPEEADWLKELETELLMFPKSSHDDVIDAASMAESILEVPNKVDDYLTDIDWNRIPKVAGGTY